MSNPKLTKSRILMAFAVAVIADGIQIPITAATDTGVFAIPGELADLLVDFVVMAATTALLGFHWVLLPSLLLEAIPNVDMLPTWTGCVAFVVMQGKNEETAPTEETVIDVSID
jgi:hypothetical protein